MGSEKLSEIPSAAGLIHFKRKANPQLSPIIPQARPKSVILDEPDNLSR